MFNRKLFKILPLLLVLIFVASTVFGAATLTPDPKFTQIDSNGDPLSGGKVYFFETGTATPKTTWTDAAKGTPNANPVVLDSNGQANIWIDSTGGQYRVRVDTSADVTQWGPVDNIDSMVTGNVGADAIFLIEHIAAGRHFAPDSFSYTDFATAVSTIGATETSLIISTSEAVTGNVTVPATLELVFRQGGELNISTGIVVTINGPLSAGPYQIFTGAGTVAFGQGYIKRYFPQWWGALGDGANDDTAEFQAALTAVAAANGGIVFFPVGVYLISSALSIDDYVTLEGAGSDSSSPSQVSALKLADSSNDNVIENADRNADGGNVGIVLRDFAIFGNNDNNSSGNMIDFLGKTGSGNNVRQWKIERVHIDKSPGASMRFNLAGEGIIKDSILGASNGDAITGISFTDSLITGNEIATGDTGTNGYDGLDFTSSSGNNIITDNFIFLNDVGIALTGGTNKQNIISNNRINTNRREGINISGSNNIDNVISSNILYDNGAAASGSQAAILLDSGASGNIIIGNRARNDQETTQLFGIRIDGATGGNLIQSNNFSGNGTAGVSDVSTGVNIIKDNIGDQKQSNLLNSVQTTDATETTLWNITLVDETAYWIIADVIGQKSDGSDRAAYRRKILVYRDAAGGATVQGAVITTDTVEDDANWDCTIDVSANTVRLRVTGVAATTVDWRANVQIVKSD